MTLVINVQIENMHHLQESVRKKDFSTLYMFETFPFLESHRAGVI